MRKILIAGIGGTGGYFGGKLAAHFADSVDVEVSFLCRGENLEAIRKDGLFVKTGEESFTAHPKIISATPADFGSVDLLICCTKSYNLEETLLQLRSCIDQNTVILPLQNGVDSFERASSLYPQNEIWKGCVYIVSRLASPGVVVDSGNLRRLLFGAVNGHSEKLARAEQIFTSAGISATHPPDIVATVWEKFSFISPLATATSYLNQNVGQLLADEKSSKLLNSLMEEFSAVAKGKGIFLAQDSMEKSWERLRTLPFETTSSMHSDVRSGKQTEVETLTGYIVREASQLGVKCPSYQMIYKKLTDALGA